MPLPSRKRSQPIFKGTPAVGGWTVSKYGNVIHQRCPKCGAAEGSLFSGPDNMAQCFTCQRKSPIDKFQKVLLRRRIVVCSSCGQDVPLTDSYLGIAGLGYICGTCSNYVAVLYGRRRLQPSLVLNFRWNSRIKTRSEKVTSNLGLMRCTTAKDYLVIRVLQAIVKNEDSRFLFIRPDEHNAALYYDSRREKYLGFIAWTEGEYAVLRQIFIVPEERRKGHAERMVGFWVRRYADRLHDKFGIESPNEKAMKLHIKMGHIQVNGNSYQSTKCFPVGIP